MKTPLPRSSGEFWAICESVTQRISVDEEGYSSRKVFSDEKIMILSIFRSHGNYMCQQPR